MHLRISETGDKDKHFNLINKCKAFAGFECGTHLVAARAAFAAEAGGGGGKTNCRMRTKPSSVTGGMASALAKNTWLVSHSRAAAVIPTVQIQQMPTVTAYRASWLPSGASLPPNTHQRLSAK